MPKMYVSSAAFFNDFVHKHDFISSASSRGCYTLKSISRRLTINTFPHYFPLNSGSFQSALLSAIPILGNIRGLISLYSIWCVKDRSNDSWSGLIIHTILGILETLGLGICLLALRIVLTVLREIIYGATHLAHVIHKKVCQNTQLRK
ncbi:hypothetical protein [Chlamydia vaughanii]|uniref:hypothetical protein n=1 Tax=Chlamydia vaughanii TaxID=3112552 RepID=UPI0032B19634